MPAAALVVLKVARLRRAWAVVPLAFALQGSAMLVTEHADGFRLPLWLDMSIAAITWMTAALVAGRPRAA